MGGLKTLVVGYDFSEGAKRAFDAALDLARAEGAEIVVVTAVPGAIGEDVWDRIVASHDTEGSAFEEVRAMEDVERLVAMGLRFHDLEDVNVRIDILEHDVSHAVARAAHMYEADMIVVGATGWSGSETARLGSQTERLLRRSVWPVLVVREHSVYPPKKVVLATDFSEASEATLRDLLPLLGHFGASLHVAHVVAGWSDAQRSIFRALPIKQDPEAAQASATTELEEWLAGFDLSGIEVTSEVAVGDPSTVLRDIVREQSADLFALGSLGASKWVGLLLGSNAERMIRSVGCSVFACKPDSFVFDIEKGTLLR